MTSNNDPLDEMLARHEARLSGNPNPTNHPQAELVAAMDEMFLRVNRPELFPENGSLLGAVAVINPHTFQAQDRAWKPYNQSENSQIADFLVVHGNALDAAKKSHLEAFLGVVEPYNGESFSPEDRED